MPKKPHLKRNHAGYWECRMQLSDTGATAIAVAPDPRRAYTLANREAYGRALYGPEEWKRELARRYTADLLAEGYSLVESQRHSSLVL